MLDYLERDAGAPKLIMLDAMGMNGETMRSLARVLEARNGAPFILTRTQRPMLESELDGPRYLEKSQSSSSRKKLRQHRRRLAESGKLEFKVCQEPRAVHQAFDDFMRLENQGWKGRNGTALLCSKAEAKFSAAMVASLAERGDASIHALYLDGKPISMQIVLRAGRIAFTWKTTYDEAFQEFSPGMLLLEEYTREFLSDRSIACVNSCAYDDKGFMSAWAERQEVAQVCISVRGGFSLRFFLFCHLQRGFLALRRAAKTFHASWRRKWKKS
jgi:CelD/BcsL family acetyltransferase involved in cellulose biosynthesis